MWRGGGAVPEENGGCNDGLLGTGYVVECSERYCIFCWFHCD
jgi:hypothetical protein